jgi:S-layer homology domain
LSHAVVFCLAFAAAVQAQNSGGCTQGFTLTCGDTGLWNNGGMGSTDAVRTYGCTPALDQHGPEHTYVFDPGFDMEIQLDLTGLSADLDIYLLRDLGQGCVPGNCVDASVFGGTTNDRIDVSVLGGRRYYVVVDGYLGAVSDYSLQLTCQGPTFSDLSPGDWATPFILAIYNAGITGGCSISPRSYCPGGLVTREQMAVFLELALNGNGFVPPPAVGLFSDLPVSYWATPWVEQLSADGITGGCTTSPLQYCPTANVIRAQMAVFLLRARYGAAYVPPPATGIFSDVPVSHWAAAWVERLYAEGITGGCSQSPLSYCPESSVTRAEMAVFLTRTFNLPVP